MADYKVADTPFNIQGDDIYTSIRRADDTTTCFQSLTVMIKQIYFFRDIAENKCIPGGIGAAGFICKARHAG